MNRLGFGRWVDLLTLKDRSFFCPVLFQLKSSVADKWTNEQTFGLVAIFVLDRQRHGRIDRQRQTEKIDR